MKTQECWGGISWTFLQTNVLKIFAWCLLEEKLRTECVKRAGPKVAGLMVSITSAIPNSTQTRLPHPANPSRAACYWPVGDHPLWLFMPLGILTAHWKCSPCVLVNTDFFTNSRENISDIETWMSRVWRFDAEPAVFEVLERLQLSFWSVLENGQAWTGGLASAWHSEGHRWDARQGNRAAHWTWNLWDHHTVFSHDTVSLLLDGDCAPSAAERWKMEGLVLVVPVVGGCHWSSVGIQGRQGYKVSCSATGVLHSEKSFWVLLISKYPIGHSFRWKLFISLWA